MNFFAVDGNSGSFLSTFSCSSSSSLISSVLSSIASSVSLSFSASASSELLSDTSKVSPSPVSLDSSPCISTTSTSASTSSASAGCSEFGCSELDSSGIASCVTITSSSALTKFAIKSGCAVLVTRKKASIRLIMLRMR